MGDKNKLAIKSWEHWFTFKISEKTEITDKELVDILNDKQLDRPNKLQLAKKREQYEKLKPTWFNNAPDSAKKKRETLKTEDKVGLMQYLYYNVSYNLDGTMNIINLHKTFCEDISYKRKKFNFAQAQELAKTNFGWYKLMTDYNDCDIDEDKKQTDRYKVINIFSQNKWDTAEWMELFRDMAWCNNRYWTGTPHKNEKWKEVKGIARSRFLDEYYIRGYWNDTNSNNRVCGFKDSM